MLSARLSAALTAISSGFGLAASTFEPARPPAVPLAVRSPYVNTWLKSSELPGTWPAFWTNAITGWSGLISVDGHAYNWMGAPPDFDKASQTSLDYTSTKSVFTLDVGGVTMTVTFLTPVHPDDPIKQSLEFSYIDVAVKSADGDSHDVAVYMDVSGEWASGDHSKVIEWDHGSADDVAFHSFHLRDETVFEESGNQANWGTWYISTADTEGLTWQIGQDTVVRSKFKLSGGLDNKKDTDFRAIQDNWPVFAFSKAFNQVSNDEQSVLFTVGVSQEEVVNFRGKDGSNATPLQSRWVGEYENGEAAMTAFFHDYSDAKEYSEALDDKIHKDSIAAAGQDFATITALSVRQTFGGLSFLKGDQPYIFLKEISSNSDIQTVDVIFPAHPILLYLNATMLKDLLEPLYVHQEAGNWPQPWAIHDLGTFPNALGYPSGEAEQMPLEECGNMVIMTLAYAQRTGDIEYLNKRWNLLSDWAEYLIEDSEYPDNQLSTDDFAGQLANQTDLAIKGIIGLKAMGKIAELTGHEDKYTSYAEDYYKTWKSLAIKHDADPPHTILSYNEPDSWGILYNIYADKLLDLNFIEQEIFDMQSNFYPTVELEYGVPLDTRHTWVKADWEVWAAAVASEDTRDLLHSSVVKYINQTPVRNMFPDLWDGETARLAGGLSFRARPVWGGAFALLALP